MKAFNLRKAQKLRNSGRRKEGFFKFSILFLMSLLLIKQLLFSKIQLRLR